jgi:glycosyltransferase involved in cell wall biosynthesis
MRVGLNALHLVPGETGGSEVYARRLVPALLEAEPTLRLTVFVGREAAGERWPDSVDVVRLPVNARSRWGRVLAEQTLLPAAVVRAPPDLLHNLFTTAPALPTVPQVTTIHDLIYKRFPQTHAGLLTYGMRVLVPLAARRSRRVIAVSEATKADVVSFLGVPAARVDVTYEGPGMPEVKPVPEAELRRTLELGDAPIVLTVSAKRPHKNLERLLDAFARVDGDAILVAPGYETPFEAQLRRRAEGSAERVRFVGWVEDSVLEGLYRAATCLAFPSLAEGFGLPVLEAMLRGVPVACSSSTSLPEIAGNAALYFDPLDVTAIADAIERLLHDEELRTRLRRAGFEQARRFSWEATATHTIRTYEAALA